jgi:prepilin-type N-terminal cleavage/methylation domain-containing protein
MLARIRKAQEENEGFTLIELLVVMIIIGILAAIAIPVFLNQRKSGYDAGAKSDVRNAATAEETYYTDNQSYVAAANLAAAVTALSPSGWKNSAHTTGFVVTTTSTGYFIKATSESTKKFCYDSDHSDLGVYTGSPAGATACT